MACPRTIFPKAITVVVELAVIFTFEKNERKNLKKIVRKEVTECNENIGNKNR